MAGLVPAIHVLMLEEIVDARDKPGHDESLDTRGYEVKRVR